MHRDLHAFCTVSVFRTHLHGAWCRSHQVAGFPWDSVRIYKVLVNLTMLWPTYILLYSRAGWYDTWRVWANVLNALNGLMLYLVGLASWYGI